MAFLGDLLIRMRADTADFQSGMGKASHVAEKHMRKISSLASNMGLALGVGGFGYFVKRIIDSQDELAKMSQKVGISVETLAGFGHAADLAGVSAEAMAKGLKSISTQMFDAANGLLESKRNFSALGIEIKKADGTLKSAETVMIEVADKFRAMRDGTEKTALAVKLFGRAGMDMIPMLNSGSAALAQMVAEGRKLNPVTAESARQAEVFNDNLTRVEKSAKTASIALLNKLLPAMRSISEEMAKTAISREGGFWASILAGAQTALTGDDVLKNLQERAKLAGQIASAEKSLDINTRAFGAADARSKASAEQLRILRERMSTSMNYFKVLQQQASAEKDADEAGKKSKFKPSLVGDAAAKKALADEDRLRKLDASGWVAHIEAKTAAYEEELKAMAELSDAFYKQEASDRALMMQQVYDEIDAEQERAIQAGADHLADLEASAKKTSEIGKNLGFTFSSAFEDAILRGEKFRDVLRGIAQDALLVIARQTVTEPIAKGIAGLFDGFRLFGGARAEGGPVIAGSSYLVGERGPEIFTAGASGMITPNGGGGGTVSMTVINHIDSRSDQATIVRLIDGSVRRSQAELVDQLNRASGSVYNAVRRA